MKAKARPVQIPEPGLCDFTGRIHLDIDVGILSSRVTLFFLGLSSPLLALPWFTKCLYFICLNSAGIQCTGHMGEVYTQLLSRILDSPLIILVS